MAVTDASDRPQQTRAVLGSHTDNAGAAIMRPNQTARTDPTIGGVESRAIAEAVCRMPQIFTVSVIGRSWT